MKHKHSLARLVHLFANGQVHTPPYSSHKFSRILSLFFLAVTLMVSGNVWGATTNKFTSGSTIYCDVSASGWTDSRTKIGVFFYYQDNPDWCYEKNSGNYNDMNGSVYVGTDYTTATRVDGEQHIYKVTVPNANLGKVCFMRVSWDDASWTWAQTVKMSVDDMGSNNCVHLNDNNGNQRNNCSWTTYNPEPCDNPKPSTDYYMAGQGLPNITWDRQSITMKWDCDKAVYYYTFSNLAADNSMTYRFKLNPSTTSGWEQQLNSDKIDNNYKTYANLTLKSDEVDKRITFDLAVKSNVTIYTDGSKVWASQEEAGDPLSSNDYYLRGDLWQKSEGNGWTDDTNKTPKFTKNKSNTKATMWYVMPSGLSKVRFEFYEGSTVQSPSNFWGSATGLTGEGTSSNKKTFDCPSSPKLLSFSYTAANKLVLTATAPELKSGFKVKYRKSGDSDWTEVALDANGEATLSNLQNNSKYYLIITDGGTLHAVNWYGGLYFDMTNSNVAFDNKIAYYSSVSTGSNYPISSIAEPNGVFNITGGNTDVTVKFDGGSIRLNKVAVTKFTVSFDSKGGSQVNSQEVVAGGHATVPTAPTKAHCEFLGWSESDGGEIVNDISSITINAAKTFYARWKELYTFHNGVKDQEGWVIYDFVDTNKDFQWQITNFVIDGSKPDYYVGKAGSFYYDNLGIGDISQKKSKSVNTTLSTQMYFAETQGTKKDDQPIGPKVGNATDAVGTLRIYENSSWDNLYVGFIPNGYGLMYGDNATENAIALKATAVGTVFMTDDVTVSAEMTNGTYHYQVGLATGTANQYVACDNSQNLYMSDMGSYVTNAWKSNLNTYPVGSKGKFRIWTDNTSKNWQCHFVPYWTLKYDLNGESGTAPQGAEVYSEASEQDRTVTITSTEPQVTHKVFEGWYTQQEGGTKLDAGSAYILNAHTTIYAHWSDAPQWTVTFDSDGGSAVASQTIWDGETATEPSPAPQKTDLSFKEWQLDGVKYDFSTPVIASITLKAVWTDDCEKLDVKYAEPVVADMTKSNLFKESDNTEPAQLTKCQIKVGSNDNNHLAYYDANDANGYIKHGSGSSDAYWWYLYTVATGQSFATDGNVYYFKNVANGKYLCLGTKIDDGNWGANYTITADKSDSNEDKCKWFYKQSSDLRLVNFSTKKNDNTSYSTGERFIHRDNTVSQASTYAVSGSSDGDQPRAVLTTTIISKTTVDNPNYLKAMVEQSGKTYYRFANNAVVSTTLPKALKAEDKITVYYYATAATTAELRINDAKVADISASAGVNTYVYTAVAADAGQTVVAVASNSTSFLMAQIEVARPTPTSPRGANLKWDEDLSAGVTRMVDDGEFTHVATAKGVGAITYSSSNEAVATVAADGTVTPVAAGTTVIKATLEQDGCYEGGEITYNVTLNDLPKPTITFTSVPSEMPQGAVQQVVVTTTAGKDFALAITSGTGATLTITEQTATQITANLAMSESATNIELTASTKRVDGVVAQHAVAQTVIVSQCIPDGSDIFSFTFSTSDAANAQPATGLVGGTVTQTALGTAGTTDNPVTVDIVTVSFKSVDGKMTGYSNGEVKGANVSDNSDYWYRIPAGQSGSKNFYYLKNYSTNQYLYRADDPTGQNDWKYCSTSTSAINSKTDFYKWYWYDKDNNGNNVRIVNVKDDKYQLHRYYNVASGKNPYVLCGEGLGQGNDQLRAVTTIIQSSAANPDMIKSVQHDSKTYYIVSSEGTITINCALKAGDTIKVDTYNRQSKEANIEKIAITADANQYVYTTTNEYLCVAGITIFRPKYGEYTTPTLSWDADLSQPQLVDLNNGGTAATHTASSNVATIKTIHYSSDNAKVKVNSESGAVTIDDPTTPDRTLATITATLDAVGCYDKATTSYTILVKNVQSTSLQDAIEATTDGGTLKLDWDYDGCDATISKKITINAQSHKIGNLTITTEGDLTLTSAMTANDLLIASNQSAAVSGQLKGAANLTLEGNAYIDIQFAGTNAITQGWYAFTVPFTVSSTSGVYNANTGAKLINEDDYAIMQYQGDVRAQGKYGWIKTHKVGGKLYAGTFYIISLGDTEYNIIRFMMDKGSATAASTSMNISEYAYSGSGTSNDAGWNGVGNPNLYYANAAIDGLSKLQTYSHDNDAYTAEDISGKNLIVGLPFFVQATADGTMTTSMAATANAPQRMLANQQTNEEFMLELSQDNKLQDRIYLSANDDASANYEIGRELIKMTMGTAKVAQIAINGYNMSLCDAEFVLTNNQALFPLTLTAPKASNYTLSVKRACEGQDLFVMNGSQVVWDLNQGDYILSLPQGTTTTYSLMLQVGDHKMPTGNDAVKATSEGVQKIILHNELRILKDGKMYNAQGIQL